MANWVKFSDRFPTEVDADEDGRVVISYGKVKSTAYLENLIEVMNAESELPNQLHWLEGVPPTPEFWTLDEVVNEYLDTIEPYLEPALLQEMRDILEKGLTTKIRNV